MVSYHSPERDKNTILSDIITNEIEVFHWHDDTFDLPDGSIAIAENQACPNQGFTWNNRVVGLQFHPEITQKNADTFFRDSGQKLGSDPYIQSPSEIFSNDQGFAQSSRIMKVILEAMER